MEGNYMAPSETMQILELLTLKNLCLTKSISMSILVSDDELKSILQQDVTTSEQHIKELKGFLEHSNIATSCKTES